MQENNESTEPLFPMLLLSSDLLHEYESVVFKNQEETRTLGEWFQQEFMHDIIVPEDSVHYSSFANMLYAQRSCDSALYAIGLVRWKIVPLSRVEHLIRRKRVC
jgi:hypothetical protein